MMSWMMLRLPPPLLRFFHRCYFPHFASSTFSFLSSFGCHSHGHCFLFLDPVVLVEIPCRRDPKRHTRRFGLEIVLQKHRPPWKIVVRIERMIARMGFGKHKPLTWMKIPRFQLVLVLPTSEEQAVAAAAGESSCRWTPPIYNPHGKIIDGMSTESVDFLFRREKIIPSTRNFEKTLPKEMKDP